MCVSARELSLSRYILQDNATLADVMTDSTCVRNKQTDMPLASLFWVQKLGGRGFTMMWTRLDYSENVECFR